MNPSDIGPHPDAPDFYFAMGKPREWEDKDCGVLHVRVVGATGDELREPAARVVRSQLPSGDEVYPAYMSEWLPTPDELERLNAGIPLRVLISGTALPPMALWVREEGEI